MSQQATEALTLIRAYATFASQNRRPLLFGAAMVALSGFCQTYVISLFGFGFQTTFGLSNSDFGTLFALATFAAAFTLPWAGTKIDRMPVARYASIASALLAGACLVIAFSPSALALAAGFYGLRLAGQRLMTHTAVTATARALPAEVGKALSVIGLGGQSHRLCCLSRLFLA